MIPYIWKTVIPLIIVHYLWPSVDATDTVVATNKVYDIKAKLPDSEIRLYLTDVSVSNHGNHPHQELHNTFTLGDLVGESEWKTPLIWDTRDVSIAQIYSR
jgi:hypothetical protein